MSNKNISRRKFINTTAITTVGLTLTGAKVFGVPAYIKSLRNLHTTVNGVQLGVVTWSFRSMDDQSIEAMLQYTLDCGVNTLELIGGPAENYAGAPQSPINRRTYYRLMYAKRKGTMTEDQQKELAELEVQNADYQKQVQQWRKNMNMAPFEKIRKMYNDAGVTIYAFKPNVFGKENTDLDIEWGIKTSQALGASHFTLEHPSDDAHTLRLGKLAEKHGIYVGYHGHEQQTPTFWDTAIAQSPKNAMNLDIGHYTAAGFNPVDLIRDKHQHIKSIHIKDRQNPENGKKNLAFGAGDTPVVETLKLMRDQNYTFPASVEFEYRIPKGSDAITETKKSVDYCIKALDA